MNKIINIKSLLCLTIFILISSFSISAIAKTSESLSFNELLHQLGYKVIPITIKNGFICIKVSVNKHPAIAKIGTTKNIVNVLKLNKSGLKDSGVDMYGRKSSIKSVILTNISVGDIQLNNVTANIFQYVKQNKVPTIIIGRDFLKHYNAIIDVYNKKLYLNNKKLTLFNFNQISQILSKQKLQSVPLVSTNDGSILMPLQINNSQPVNFLFDTGTGVTLISQEYTKMLGLELCDENKEVLIKKLIMNPLNLSFQPKVSLSDIFAQPENFTFLRKHLYVQGIFGLSEMIKVHAIIFLGAGVIFVRSD